MPILPYTYQLVDQTPRQDDNLTDLSVIGVPPALQNGFPIAEAYPSTFVPDAKEVWDYMLSSAEYVSKTIGKTIDGQWHTAIQLFLSMCQDLGISPFEHSTPTAGNAMILYQMRMYRLKLARYIDQTHLFDNDVFRVRTAYREYVRGNDNLILSSWAELYPVVGIDRMEFEARLRDPAGPFRFIKYVENHLVHVILPPLQVWIKCINMHRIEIGFTLEMKGQLTVPGNKTPSRKDVNQWLDSQWIPLVRQIKFNGVSTRLF